MVLGRDTISLLNVIDKTVRVFVRQWLALSNDTPTAYFHALVTEEGLGIPLQIDVPPSEAEKVASNASTP